MNQSHLTRYDSAIPVAVVIANWNGREHLETCLGSLLAQALAGIEIIVVDNGSTDGSVAWIRERFENRIKVLPQSSNLGYGAAVNVGIRAARGRYLFALNNDTEVDRLCLQSLVATADRFPNAGSVAPKILQFTNRGTIDNVGHLFYPDGLTRGRGRLEEDHGQYDEEAEVIVASGCAMLLRRSMLADVGLFDENLFAYCDDADLGLRARVAGWSCRYVPAARVYHKYSASSDAYSPLKAFLVERNRAWVAIKCLPAPLLAMSPFFTALRLGAQAWGALRRRGAAGRFVAAHSPAALLWVLVRAWAAAARGLPRAARERRGIQALRRITNADARVWMKRYGMGVREVAWKE